jgi:hypothetical protein
MCPACLATLSMIVAGAISTGGVTVLAAKAFEKKRDSKEVNGQSGGGDGTERTRPEGKEKQQ